MVKTFRILVANQPKLMRELLVEMLAEESWIEIVGEVAHEVEDSRVGAKDCAGPSGSYGRQTGQAARNLRRTASRVSGTAHHRGCAPR